jgi:uncharacterized protein (UPF0212 family)
MKLTCPRCKQQHDRCFAEIKSQLALASDFSFVAAMVVCPECGKEISLMWILEDDANLLGNPF